jgi:predicted Fe-S protein YdhL (DUF1289 family)
MHQRTPCVGICSTTYGDLVCRGCKRFSHEIVGWNAYSDPQRREIETRLRQLRRGAALVWVRVADFEQVRRAAADMAVALDPADPESSLWELLRRSVRHRLQLADLGLALVDRAEARDVQAGTGHDEEPGNADLRILVNLIDREFYLRSLAHYERSYRVPAL